jgi:hypothetical protein
MKKKKDEKMHFQQTYCCDIPSQLGAFLCCHFGLPEGQMRTQGKNTNQLNNSGRNVAATRICRLVKELAVGLRQYFFFSCSHASVAYNAQ